jgi:hypothetical protein
LPARLSALTDGGGKNEPSGAHLEAAKKETARIEPLNAEGNAAKDGKIEIVLLGVVGLDN